MEDVIFLDHFSEVANSIKEKISASHQIKLCGYDFESIKNYLEDADTKPKLILIHANFENHDEEKCVKLLMQYRYDLNYIIMGTVAECREFYESPAFSVLKYIVTPTKVSDIVSTINSLLDKIDGVHPVEKQVFVDTRKKVLIVDDDPLILRTMSNCLKEYYKVLIAKSGTAAISLLGKDIPDVILLDYDMPVISGVQTLQMIKSEKEYENIPVFFLTGVSDPNLVKQALACKPEGYILKTTKQQAILEKINEFFGV